MKANELMIGDFVQYDDEILKVEELYTASGCYRINSDEYSIDYAKPIPLTPEVLKLNNVGKYLSYDFSQGYLMFQIGFRTIDIKYVHELQHALRLCCLNELADNFKV